MCECMNWARTDGAPLVTNHHPRCAHFNDSLIDVWVIVHGGRSCVTEEKLVGLEDGETVIKIKMHRECFEQLDEFEGY